MPDKPAAAFHAVTITFDGITNRVITEVRIFEAFDPLSPLADPPRSVITQALWDTGATNSLITADTAQALGIPVFGSVDMQHAGGVSTTPTYLLNIGLPNNVMISGVIANQCENIVGSFGAIIGMDIICGGDFSITNRAGRTSMSFRVPSISTIDYVMEANRIKFAGVNRNAPCPCGATGPDGKPIKFKKCCGKHQ